MSKKNLIIISVVYCCFAFILPFIIADSNDGLLSILSTSFTAVGTFASLITLYIAISIFQRYGIESRFIEKQIDKTLELVDMLKGKIVYIKTDSFTYFMRFKDDSEFLKKDKFYLKIKDKTVFMGYEDYEKGVIDILNISRSYWLPSSIRENLNFLEIRAFWNKGEYDENISFVKVYFNNEGGQFAPTIPNLTVEEFINNKNKLVNSIEDWISKHSEIKIDLRMDEANKLY